MGTKRRWELGDSKISHCQYRGEGDGGQGTCLRQGYGAAGCLALPIQTAAQEHTRVVQPYHRIRAGAQPYEELRLRRNRISH